MFPALAVRSPRRRGPRRRALPGPLRRPGARSSDSPASGRSSSRWTTCTGRTTPRSSCSATSCGGRRARRVLLALSLSSVHSVPAGLVGGSRPRRARRSGDADRARPAEPRRGRPPPRRRLDRELRAELYRESGGNPFYLEQLRGMALTAGAARLRGPVGHGSPLPRRWRPRSPRSSAPAAETRDASAGGGGGGRPVLARSGRRRPRKCPRPACAGSSTSCSRSA